MRRTIETAPRDGNVVILEDDASGIYDVAHWSPEAGEWVAENGEPSKITTPTHWHTIPQHTIPHDKYLVQEPGGSSSRSHAGPSASPARSYRFSFPFSASRAAPQRSAARKFIAPRSIGMAAPATVEAFEAQSARLQAKRAPLARWRLAASSIAAILLAATLIATYFRAGIAAYVTPQSDQQDITRVSAIGGQVVKQQTNLPNQDSQKRTALALQQQEAPAPEARQSSEKEKRIEVLANELAEARRTINGLNLQLRTAAANSAQSLGQERRDATAVRQQLAASTLQLEQERARSATLAGQLAAARREMETQSALSGKTDDEAAQLKQPAESTAELRQSLQQEHDRAEALASELATARRDLDTQAALSGKTGDEAAQLRRAAESAKAELQQEHDRADALASELTTARRDLETQAALSGKAGDEAQHLRQAAESTMVELRQSLQQEHDRAEALASELATARRDINTQAALSSKTGDDAAQLEQAAAEGATAELRQSLQREHNRADALAGNLESMRLTIDGRVAVEPAANGQTAEVTQAAEATEQQLAAPVAAEAQGSPEATRLIARANALLGQGDIGAARIVLERAAEMGSAQASFMLAQTYDPVILSAWGTFGTRGEATKAREFYAKAQAGGIQEAKDRLDALGQ